ncbi:Fc receptor-like protein 3 [Zonotrichia albicollis]|uniref:Fc receptor-like protein 3 n=1 Tax=Zonotrichia albicollis TaxID=44394 RepID=UPI003D80F72C
MVVPEHRKGAQVPLRCECWDGHGVSEPTVAACPKPLSRCVGTERCQGTQTTQLLVEPSWRPAVLWDWVTLTCKGSGNTGVTTWYKDGRRWRQEAHNRLTVTEKGNYTCERPGTGLSPPVRVLDVSFYHEEKKLQELRDRTELSLSPLQLQHSGRYSCRGWVKSTVSRGWEKSESVTVTVHELFTVPVLVVHSEPTNGSPLTLSCLSTRSPLRPQAPLLHMFYRDGRVLGGPQGSPQLLPCAELYGGHRERSSVHFLVPGRAQGTAWHWPCLELHHTGDNGSGYCQCRDSMAESVPLNITVLSLRKQQERGRPVPSAPPEAGEVLYSQVMRNKKAGVPPCATTPQVTNAELPGPHGQQQDSSDIYENML